MVRSMMDLGKMESNMELQDLQTQRAKVDKVSGRMENELNGLVKF